MDKVEDIRTEKGRKHNMSILIENRISWDTERQEVGVGWSIGTHVSSPTNQQSSGKAAYQQGHFGSAPDETSNQGDKYTRKQGECG